MPIRSQHRAPAWCVLDLDIARVAATGDQGATINQQDDVKELRLALGSLRKEYGQRIAALKKRLTVAEQAPVVASTKPQLAAVAAPPRPATPHHTTTQYAKQYLRYRRQCVQSSD